MPNVTLSEVAADQPITGIAEGISAVLVHSDRGPLNVPVLVTGFDQFKQTFGYYRNDSYSSYDVRGYFENGGRLLYVVRVAGLAARNAGGAYGTKTGPSLAQLVHGAGDAALRVVSDIAGADGLLTNLRIVANSGDETEVELNNGVDILLHTADTSAWKRSARVCSTVLNGQAHLIFASTAVEDIDNSVVFYAADSGVGGNSLSVRVINSGGIGGLAVTYNAGGDVLTIDLDGATPAASAVVAEVNVLAGSILSYTTGTGAGTWDATTAQTNLAHGIASIDSLITASYGGTGLSAVVVMSRTWLAGTGSVTAGSAIFADTTALTPLTLVTAGVIPGTKLIIFNGANKGCYSVQEVTAQNGLVISENFGTTQANCIYAVLGTASAYGYMGADLLSPGARGAYFTLQVRKEPRSNTLRATLRVVDGDNSITTLEEFENLSPVYTDPRFIGTILSSDSKWVTFDAFPEYVKASGTGSSVAASNLLEHVGAAFVDEGVEVGDYVAVESATTAADVRVLEVVEVVDNENLRLSENFVGTQADVVYSILGQDPTGNALMALIGTSSTGRTITFSGGVDAVPTSVQYIGDSTLRTGVYALDAIPVRSRPTKLWVPDAPIVVDGSGVDATDVLNQTMGEFCSSLARQYLRYAFMNERGLSPQQAIIAAESDGIDNRFVAQYYNWGKVNDAVSGTLKLVPLVGHMTGQAVAMGAGLIGEGDHQAAANVVIQGVVGLEYEVADAEADLLNENNINCIRNWNGIRNMGDRVRTSDSAWRWLHKRDVAIRLNQSMLQSLKTWANFTVNAPSTYGRITKVIDAYLRQEDRRLIPNGALLNPKDPSAMPYYVSCKPETPGNALNKTKVYALIGYSIVDTVEDVELKVGLWDGGATLEEV